MSGRELRRAMARDLHYVGVPGDLEAIADFLITRRGWTKAEPESALRSALRPLIRDDAPNTVRVGITGFTPNGEPVVGNVARTAVERVAAARMRQEGSRRG